DQAEQVDDSVTAASTRMMDLAREAFRNGDYILAQREVERAIELLPGDTNLHEFRALCLFARGQYKDAAAVLYSVLATGPGWDWDTLASFYPDTETYTGQLRGLEAYVRDNPDEAAGHFLLGYHYLVLDDRGAALEEFRQVTKLQPNDRVAAGLVDALKS